MKNQIIFVLIFVSIPFLAKTQTGPGGIEDTTGSSPLLLWLKADFGIQVSDNDSVDVWNDQSGYQHDADSLRSDARPVYLLDRVNGNPAVQFNGGNDQRLSIPHSSSLDHNGDYTLFMLISPENSSEQFPFFLSKFLSEINSQYHLGFESTFKLQSWFGVPTMASDAAVSNQTFSFLPGSYSLVTSQVTFSNPTSALSYFINGTLDNTKLINGQTPINTQPLFIGGGVQGASERDVTGDIAEVIIISRSIAEVERVLVENYLEAKYGGQGVENLFDISNDIF
ncbi:MAG: LamG-like jellyroll fold domain-containing protein, partial [Bacteroidota bacterium]